MRNTKIDQILSLIDSTLELSATEILGNYEMVLTRVFGVETDEVFKPAVAHTYTRNQYFEPCDCSCHSYNNGPGHGTQITDDEDGSINWCCECHDPQGCCMCDRPSRYVSATGFCPQCQQEILEAEESAREDAEADRIADLYEAHLSAAADYHHSGQYEADSIRGGCTVCDADLFWTLDEDEDSQSTCLQCRGL